MVVEVGDDHGVVVEKGIHHDLEMEHDADAVAAAVVEKMVLLVV